MCFFLLIEQHSKFLLRTSKVLYICTLCDSTNINKIIEFVPNWQVVKTPKIISNNPVLKVLQSTQVFFITKNSTRIWTGAIPLCCNIVTIYYVNNTTYINHQLLKVKILATCFSNSEPSSGQKRNIVRGTFSDCALCGIPQSVQSVNVPELCSVFGPMMAHCSWNMLPRF